MDMMLLAKRRVIGTKPTSANNAFVLSKKYCILSKALHGHFTATLAVPPRIRT